MLSKLKKYHCDSRKGFFLLFVGLLGVLFANGALAVTIQTISQHIDSAVGSVSHVLQDVSTITGVGFIIASFFKLHQHKLNPTQVPMSQGITLLLIGAGLSVFPHLLNVVTSGIFGATAVRIGTGITAIGS